jgi:ATP-dependent DNA ligase
MLSDFTAVANAIAETTKKSVKERLLADDYVHHTTIEKYGSVLKVEPRIMLEIAFDRIQESERHKSGYALRFPRMARIRDDKTVEQISTIDEVRRIYEGQMKREEGPKTED